VTRHSELSDHELTIDLRTDNPLADPMVIPPRSDAPAELSVGSTPVADAIDAHSAPIPPARPPSLRRWQRRYLLCVAGSDLAAMLLSVALVLTLRPQFLSGVDPASHRLLVAIGLIGVWFVSLFTTHAYESRRLAGGRINGRRVSHAAAATGFVLLAGSAFLHGPSLIGFVSWVIVIGLILQIGGRTGLALMLRVMRRRGSCCFRVIVVGNADQVARVAVQSARTPGSGWNVIGVCVGEPGTTNIARLETSLGRLEVHGRTTDAAEVADKLHADAVMVVTGALGPRETRALAWELERERVRLVLVHDLAGIHHGRLIASALGDAPLLEVRQPVRAGWAKGMVDRAAAGIALLFLSPLFLLIAALIRLDSRGPGFFRQTRIGRDGKPFTCWKFRSMHTDAEERLAELQHANEHDGTLFKIRDDPRVTRVGRFLRKYSLDELPQLINVANGSMSLVGPRPPLPKEVAEYGDDVRRRLLVKPGLTGLWQVSGRSDLTWEESVRLDLFYVENWSHALDMHILARTVSAVVASRGAY
jgi:exopolysaccharide biosynthesis polyprenyl glycosylphosphotransferase